MKRSNVISVPHGGNNFLNKMNDYRDIVLSDKKDDYYFLLNNDTIIKNDTISKLIFALRKYGENNIALLGINYKYESDIICEIKL